jgi:hypothetical protein
LDQKHERSQCTVEIGISGACDDLADEQITDVRVRKLALGANGSVDPFTRRSSSSTVQGDSPAATARWRRGVDSACSEPIS